jgi:hypothetical protein
MAAVQTRSDADAGTIRAEQRFGGLLPRRALRWRRPVWWQELAFVLVGYWVYSLSRNAVPKQISIAERHGRAVQHLTEDLHLNWELSVNKWFAAHEWAATIIDYYYATLHFLVTPAVLIWLFVRRPQVYRGARTVLLVTSVLALIGFYLYPTAPPRLLPQYGYIDTVIKFHTWGSLANHNVASQSNQYAAMPSLHIGWAAWCGAALVMCAQRPWLRILGALYPLATLTVIVGTANHFILDAVGGGVILVAGFAIQYAMSGHGAFVSPADAPPMTGAGPGLMRRPKAKVRHNRVRQE